jgi:hypothetical protein
VLSLSVLRLPDHMAGARMKGAPAGRRPTATPEKGRRYELSECGIRPVRERSAEQACQRKTGRSSRKQNLGPQALSESYTSGMGCSLFAPRSVYFAIEKMPFSGRFSVHSRASPNSARIPVFRLGSTRIAINEALMLLRQRRIPSLSQMQNDDVNDTSALEIPD